MKHHLLRMAKITAVLIVLAFGAVALEALRHPHEPAAANSDGSGSIAVSNSGDNPAINTDQLDVYKIWLDVNAERTKAGLKPLVLNPALNDSAAAKCMDMQTKQYWDHFAPDGTSPWYFIKQHFGFYRTAGENLAADYDTSAGTVLGWMNSPEHKANILNGSFTETGLALCDGYSLHHSIVVQHFAG